MTGHSDDHLNALARVHQRLAAATALVRRGQLKDAVETIQAQMDELSMIDASMPARIEAVHADLARDRN